MVQNRKRNKRLRPTKRLAGFVVLGLIICIQSSCFILLYRYNDLPDYTEPEFEGGLVGTSIYTFDPTQQTFNESTSHAKYKISIVSDSILSMKYVIYKAGPNQIADTINYFINNYNLSNSWCNIYEGKPEQKNEYYWNNSNVKMNFIASLNSFKGCDTCIINKFTMEYEGGCFTIYENEQMGVVKRYGPTVYDSYEINYLIGTPKYYYTEKLLNAIKGDKTFHTRCDGGVIW